MDIKITQASSDDVPALNTLVNSAYRGEASKKGWTSEADLLDGTRVDENILRDLIFKTDTTILKYEQGGNLVGCVELRKEGRKLYLGMLSVKPDMQANGVGKKILEASELFARSQQCSSICMMVISVRQSLIDWYIRKGYQLTGKRKPFIVPDSRWGIPRQELEFVVLEKKLIKM